MATSETLIERTGELSTLTEAIGAAQVGDGCFIVVEGPAGIGKTSLLSEARRIAHGMGAQVLAARGSELERQFSFGIARQLFEAPVARLDDDESKALFAGPTGAVFGHLDGQHTPVGDFAVLHGLYELTARLASEHPLVLIVDDLHWVDRASLRFLAYLLPRTTGLHVVALTATRPHEPNAEQNLLNMLILDDSSIVIRPSALSPGGTAQVLRSETGLDAETPFVEACHTATGGNPLLLHELVRAIADEGIPGTAENVGLVEQLRIAALAKRIQSRLEQLPAECAALAHAVALLGDDAPLPLATELSGFGPAHAGRAADRLCRIQILKWTGTPETPRLAFIHPLIRASVYGTLSIAERHERHETAAKILEREGADPEQVASHLLRISPVGADSVPALRRAARSAVARGSPDTAIAYLQPCLHGVLSDADRLQILEELAFAAQTVDNELAASYLQQALAVAKDPGRRALIAGALGNIQMLLMRFDSAAETWKLALADLPSQDDDFARRLHANLVNLAVIDPQHRKLLDAIPRLKRLPFDDSAGGRALESLIGAYDSLRCEPTAAEHALRALQGDVLMEEAPGEAPLVVAWFVLIFTDVPQVMPSIETAVANAYRKGAIKDLTAGLTFRALARYRWGDLAGAEADARACMEAVDASAMSVARPFIGPFYADVLLEQNRIAEAQQVMSWTGIPTPLPPSGPMYYFLDTRARLIRHQRDFQQALETALEAGGRFADHGGSNPGWLPWRSEAALCLHALGRTAEAIEYAESEINLARAANAPRAIGRAQRVAGTVTGGKTGIAFLRDAVATLEHSPAELEYAKALVGLGSALCREGQRKEAKPYLTKGSRLARRCHADPLVARAADELGGPSGEDAPAGESLTTSELRVARLASTGLTNREIAQQLSITPKTVEVHLGSAYRKLGITRRAQLAGHPAMTAPPP